MAPEHTLFPSIIPDSNDDFVDDSYGADELDRKEYSELKSIAADHPSDDVHGRMDMETLKEKLEGLERV